MNKYIRKIVCGNYEIVVTPTTTAEVYFRPQASLLSDAYDTVYEKIDRPIPYVSKYWSSKIVDFLNNNKSVALDHLVSSNRPMDDQAFCKASIFLSRNNYKQNDLPFLNQDIPYDLVCIYPYNMGMYCKAASGLRIKEDILPFLKTCKAQAEKRKLEIADENKKIRAKNAAIEAQQRTAIGRFFAPTKREYITESTDKYIRILPEINRFYEILTNETSRIAQEQTCYEKKQIWINKHYGNSFLLVQTGEEREIFFEGECGFDIAIAKRDLEEAILSLRTEQQKNDCSTNSGERAVEYALKWFSAGCSNRIVAIKNNCSSNYRGNCIMLSKPEFIDEPQEYDHILVGAFGVAIIETKHWKGRIKITTDGKWLRYSDDSTAPEGVTNPKAQMQRHELLLQNILPNIPIYNILCFSNETAVIEGVSNFTEYCLIRLDQLGETLAKLLEVNTYSDAEIDEIIQQIEKHKVCVTNKH